jgi:hypothetical protein
MHSTSTNGSNHTIRENPRRQRAPGRISNSTAVVEKLEVPSANVGSQTACLSRKAGPSMAHNSRLILRDSANLVFVTPAASPNSPRASGRSSPSPEVRILKTVHEGPACGAPQSGSSRGVARPPRGRVAQRQDAPPSALVDLSRFDSSRVGNNTPVVGKGPRAAPGVRVKPSRLARSSSHRTSVTPSNPPTPHSPFTIASALELLRNPDAQSREWAIRHASPPRSTSKRPPDCPTDHRTGPVVLRPTLRLVARTHLGFWKKLGHPVPDFSEIGGLRAQPPNTLAGTLFADVSQCDAS